MKPRKMFLSLLAVAIVVTGCNVLSPTSDPAGGEVAGDGFPVTLDTPLGEVVIDARPERVVSLSATATEMLFAIGAGEQVVAVDEFSNYPEDAPITDLSGFTPNVEAIATYEPDLVLIQDDIDDLVKGLDALGIPALSQPAAADFDEAFGQILQLGEATGNSGSASDLVAEIEGKVEELTASAPDLGAASTYYHELDTTYFTATSATFIGQAYSLFGLTNIADEADPDGFGYPQLSEEFIISANPSYIFLADVICCKESPDTVAARPGWSETDAVKNKKVFELNDDIASRWGPRITEFMELVAGAIG